METGYRQGGKIIRCKKTYPFLLYRHQSAKTGSQDGGQPLISMVSTMQETASIT